VRGSLNRWKKIWMTSIPTTRPVMKLSSSMPVRNRRTTSATMMTNVTLS